MIPISKVQQNLSKVQQNLIRIVHLVAWRRGAERRPHLHALENEINAEAILAFDAPQKGPDVILFANALFRPLDGNPVPLRSLNGTIW